MLGLRLDEPLPLAGLEDAVDADALARLERLGLAERAAAARRSCSPSAAASSAAASRPSCSPSGGAGSGVRLPCK